ncbi:hypothetical protein SASPL_132061 [Salvia splendens]|uniref:Uncharacterized protein n=1 Tax=Salvia splendens TaxID=180675 RepID=A0A8X8ZL71_SALSN|nr:hypothetical protein SASPL_132061 [Salvia splendens]
MDSERPSPIIAAAFCLVLIGVQLSKSSALVAAPDFNPPYPKAISVSFDSIYFGLREAIVKGLGLQADDFKVSGFDLRDALVGRSVAYEFDVEIENKVIPLKLLEDVNRWEYVDLPLFQVENRARPGEEIVLSERQKVDDQMPVLAPFQLAGPMELWIQDAENMRISLPHDVDAGVLKKVILADGAVVTVKGARSVSLRHPVELPLPLNITDNGFASGLISLAERLQDVARSNDAPVLSLRIVGPTSLTSPAPSPSLLQQPPQAQAPCAWPSGAVLYFQEPGQGNTLWPVVSLNGSNPNLLGFEALLSSVLGPRGGKEGSFKVLKADVSAQTFVKIGFGVEKRLREGDVVGMPEWRTKPSTMRMHFEVLGKVDGDRIVPERVAQVNPVIAEDSVAQSALLGNVTMSKMPVVHHPPNPFML